MICAEQISQKFGKCPFDNGHYKSVRCVTCERPFECITGIDMVPPYEHDYDFSDGEADFNDQGDQDDQDAQCTEINLLDFLLLLFLL